MRCLVITPIPTLPANQGNAVNTARLNQCLQASGGHVHMVYSTFEGAADWQLDGMRAECDVLDVIPLTIDIPSATGGYRLDDWFDPAVGAHVARLCAMRQFDLAVIHYVWMSAASAYLPADLPKILYTHDRFGDRHLMLARAGITPTWYSISVADEAKGLSRADFIIATQETEAAYFRSIVDKPVHVLGSLQALRSRPALLGPKSAKLRAGYLGSANPSNQSSIRALLDAIDCDGRLGPGNFELVLAGPVSLLPEFARPYTVSLGQVERIEDLFRRVDVMLNPSVGGSGLKIKTVECLAAGMPLVSTEDGMMGLIADHPALACSDAEQLVCKLFETTDPRAFDELVAACRRSIEHYCAAQVTAFTRLLEALRLKPETRLA